MVKERVRKVGTSISSNQVNAPKMRQGFWILENTSTARFSCFILDAAVPYALATLQAPHGERKGLRKKAKQWSVVTPISIMHRKAHISQGFEQGLQIGCGGSQMTSGPQFPPCGIENLWLTLWGREGWHLPLKTCWRWILTPLKCTSPLLPAYDFGEFGDFQLQSKVP